jgi:hypothetical protein
LRVLRINDRFIRYSIKARGSRAPDKIRKLRGNRREHTRIYRGGIWADRKQPISERNPIAEPVVHAASQINLGLEGYHSTQNDKEDG